MNKVNLVLREFKNKTLRMPTGKIVRKRKQAIAIALNEARRNKEFVPSPRRSRKHRMKYR